jgi:hypothetical protein
MNARGENRLLRHNGVGPDAAVGPYLLEFGLRTLSDIRSPGQAETARRNRL